MNTTVAPGGPTVLLRTEFRAPSSGRAAAVLSAQGSYTWAGTASADPSPSFRFEALLTNVTPGGPAAGGPRILHATDMATSAAGPMWSRTYTTHADVTAGCHYTMTIRLATDIASKTTVMIASSAKPDHYATLTMHLPASP